MRTYVVLCRIDHSDAWEVLIEDVPVHRIDDLTDQVVAINQRLGWQKYKIGQASEPELTR